MLSIHDHSFGFHLQSVENKKLRLCLFDLDHTLIQPKSGKVFPENANDWKWMFPSILETFKNQYQHENDFLCIISNQKNLLEDDKKKKLEEFEQKLQQINQCFLDQNIHMNYLVSFRDDFYRKPLTGLFDYLKEYLKKSGNKVDMKSSFYCGDGAGRVYGNGKKDFSRSDIYFAHNCGLTFYTPEHIFLGETMPTLILPERPFLTCSYELPKIKIDQLFFILINGPPASGKSFLAEMIQEKYGGVIVETDKIKNKEKVVKKVMEEIKNVKSVILVGTYPEKEEREKIIQKIKEEKMEVNMYGIEMKTSKELIQHLNAYRVQSTENKRSKIPEVAYRVYYKKYQAMQLQEGYKYIFDGIPCLQDIKKKEMFYYYI